MSHCRSCSGSPRWPASPGGAEQTDFYITLALRLAAIHNPELQPAADGRVAEGIAAHEDLFAAVLAAHGRRIRAPYTAHHLSATVAALAEGFAVQDCTRSRHPRIHRDDVPPGVGPDWTLFGVVLHMLLESFTEPADR